MNSLKGIQRFQTTEQGNRGKVKVTAIIAIMIVLSAALSAVAVVKPKTFTLWQLPEQTQSQMMSYVIRTPNDKVIVIDGGTIGDTLYLRKFIADVGGKVEAWFLTHAHPDHVGAPAAIFRDPEGLQIGRIYASLPTEAWVKQYDSGYASSIVELNAALQESNRTAIELPLGAELIFDGVHFDVFSIKNPEIHAGTQNNSSLVLRIWDSVKSVLFLGDLGPEAGEKMLQGDYASKLKSDYCQMAHHGQSGVNEDVYKAIHPTYCLWTTPKWLWDNDNGGGKGSGPWATLETRKWTEELGVKRNYVTSIDGLVKID